ncbi:MAG: hypothetical protein DMG21_21760 [Acidobacteria bacterium]|nr:MAG: hypothetical protein DMG21_21760 [Acidobacteriota bacterium]
MCFAAAGLGHELVHASLDHWWNFGPAGTDGDYDNEEDKYIIQKFEHRLTDLGEGMRYNHRGSLYTVPTVTSRQGVRYGETLAGIVRLCVCGGTSRLPAFGTHTLSR